MPAVASDVAASVTLEARDMLYGFFDRIASIISVTAVKLSNWLDKLKYTM